MFFPQHVLQFSELFFFKLYILIDALLAFALSLAPPFIIPNFLSLSLVLPMISSYQHIHDLHKENSDLLP
jgi:hypothetical protein